MSASTWYYESPEPPKDCRWSSGLILFTWVTRDPHLDHLMSVAEAVEYLDDRFATAMATNGPTSPWSNQLIAQTWNVWEPRLRREMTVAEAIEYLETGRRLVDGLPRFGPGHDAVDVGLLGDSAPADNGEGVA